MVPSEDICLGQRMVLLKVDDRICVGRLLLWQIYSDSVQDHFRLAANGSTVGNVRLPVLRTTPIWLPPIDEQRRIVAYLDEQTSKIDALIVDCDLNGSSHLLHELAQAQVQPKTVPLVIMGGRQCMPRLDQTSALFAFEKPISV